MTKPFKIPESVLVVIHSTEHQILLLERADHPGFWQSVTGSKDSLDEPPAQTALRELQEETGLVARLASEADAEGTPGVLRDMQHHIQYEIFEHWRWRYGPGVTHNTEHWFSVCVQAGFNPQLSPREHLQAVWLPWEEAAQRCFSWSNCDAIKRLATAW